ncbi:MAG: aldehyde dehydrogenase family protein [Pseudoflavonifractor sp.]|nr:aldehyde dehydrogenase family protein [Pseudoflavonifractor sp.]
MEVNGKKFEQLAALVSEKLAKELQRPCETCQCETPDAATSSACIFASMEEAIETAYKAQKKFSVMTLEDRRRITDSIVSHLMTHVRELAQMGVDETGMGNVEDKVFKHKMILQKTPSVEMLKPEVFTGDHGVTLIEMSPFGVIGALTPSTNPSETIINNSIIMLAAGNSVVFCPHPGACKTSNRAVTLVNEAVAAAGGPEGLVVSIDNPTMDKSQIMFKHKKISMLCATGGPGVVQAVLSSGKKAIGAGAGNPPVLVDDTVDLNKAAKDIIDGCTFDNNLPCIAEKSVVVLDHVGDKLIEDMRRNGAYLLTDEETISRLTKMVLPDGETPSREFVGRSAVNILAKLNITAPPTTRVIIFEAQPEHPLVMNEQLMPVLPIVRVSDVHKGIDLCCEIEGGRRHSAICHSNDVNVLSEYGRRVQTTIFVKNGPSFAGSGAGGEGYTTATIAGPTGEGLVTAANFTRKRRCVMVDSFYIR